jgi:hypothetical protein
MTTRPRPDTRSRPQYLPAAGGTGWVCGGGDWVLVGRKVGCVKAAGRTVFVSPPLVPEGRPSGSKLRICYPALQPVAVIN